VVPPLLTRSLSSSHRTIRSVGVSASTGEGINSLFSKVTYIRSPSFPITSSSLSRQIEEAAEEFREVYLPDLQKKIAERDDLETKRQLKDLAALQLDMKGSAAADEEQEEEDHE
jgi:hypothetical protein